MKGNGHIRNYTVACDRKEKSTRTLKEQKGHDKRSKSDGEKKYDTRSVVQLKLHES